MSYPIYYVPAGDVLPVLFDTFDGGTGASITLTGLAVTDVEIYKDGGVTQRASDAGYTLLDTDGIDFDGITGIHGFSIDTGDNTDAGFYTVGSWFHVVVSSVTVDAQTVNFIACAFRLMPAESAAATPKVDVSTWDGTDVTTGVPLAPTTAGRTLDVSAGGEAGVDWANIGSPTTVVNLSGTTIKTATDVETDTAEIGAAGAGLTNINLPDQTMNITGNITGNLSGSVGSVTGAVGSVTGAVGSVTGAVGSVTGNVGGNVTGSVGSVAVGGIDATSFAAGAIDAAAIAASALGTSEIAATVDARIADAIWDEARSGHTTSGTYGENNSVIESAAAVTGTLSTTQATTNLSNATNDAYNGRTIIFKGNVTAALKNQATNVTDYVGASGLLTFTAITDAPADGDAFVVV